MKANRIIDKDTSNPVNPALVGFPVWCQLDSLESTEDTDYRKNIEQIMQIMKANTPEALQVASHYLNSVFANRKAKTA
jgi:hypothetical protein